MASKVDPTTAENEFNRFCEAMGLDFEPESFDEETAEEFDGHKKRIIKAIQSGAAVVDENGAISYTPQRSDYSNPIIFSEPTGASLMAMDRMKKSEDMKRLCAGIGDMTGTPVAVFSKLVVKDLKVCVSIATLFLVD